MQIPSIARSSSVAAAALIGLSATTLAAGGGLEGEQPSPYSLQAPPAAPAQNPDDLRVYWRGGLRMETADKAFTLSVIGRIHNDWVWHSADDELDQAFGDQPEGPFSDGTRFRRARLGVAGTMYDHLFYKAEFDFASGTAGYRDVYLGTNLYEFASIRVGHFKEFFGLEQLTSSNNITFVERSLPDVFTPAFNTGLGLNQDFADERGTWGVGVFRTTDEVGSDVGGDDDASYAFTGRATYLPLYRDGGEHLVHVGASATFRNQDGDTLRYRQRPENSFAPRLVDTGNFAAEDQTVYGVEAAWVRGSLSLQGEYMIADVSSEAEDDPSFSGYYAMISYFLTGERRRYGTTSGAFAAVRPERNFGRDGKGAWELAARYSSLDLEDGGIEGGELDDITFGLNWYWNPNVRTMLNYIRSELEGGAAEGDAEAILLRFQVVF